jgi:hypothetical protein
MSLLSDSSSQTGTPDNQSGSSAPANVQPGSETFTITKAQWDSLQGEIQTLRSGAQSEKDRAVRKTNERLDKLEGDIRPMLERALQHTASGKSAEEALRLVQSEQDENQTKQALAEFAAACKSGKLPEGFGVGSAQNSGVDVAKVLADYQLDPKDPFVAGKLGGKTFASEAEAELAVARIFREVKSTSTNPAQQSAKPGEAAGSSDTQAKIARLQELQKRPSQNMQEIMKLSKELDAAGWQ